MTGSTRWTHGWVYYLTAGVLFGAALLRPLLAYQDSAVLVRILALLSIGLALFIAHELLSRRGSAIFPYYLIFQTSLIVALLFMPGFPDYFAVLFGILSMQIMWRYSPTRGAVWIGLFAPCMFIPLLRSYGFAEAIAFTLVYTALCVFLAAYSLATKRAKDAWSYANALAGELRTANRDLQNYARRLERLGVSRERNRLARDLHDSVTQTVFSMTLTTQSALMLLDRDSDQAMGQMKRLRQLIESAISEMGTLIAELRPDQLDAGGLAAALRRHLNEAPFPESLSVSLHVEGEQALTPAEEQGLFRIVQEALNNTIKHAKTDHAQVRLHFAEPPWVEIEDQGEGFDLEHATGLGRVGLISMGERADEIGWRLHVTSSAGGGTRVRVEKKPLGERQA